MKRAIKLLMLALVLIPVSVVMGACFGSNAIAPKIATQPQDVTVTVGETITLTVAATVQDGGTISYQWYTNTTKSSDGGTAVADATKATYSPSSAQAGTTYYYVVIKNTYDVGGSAIITETRSNAVMVAVNALSVVHTINGEYVFDRVEFGNISFTIEDYPGAINNQGKRNELVEYLGDEKITEIKRKSDVKSLYTDYMLLELFSAPITFDEVEYNEKLADINDRYGEEVAEKCVDLLNRGLTVDGDKEEIGAEIMQLFVTLNEPVDVYDYTYFIINWALGGGGDAYKIFEDTLTSYHVGASGLEEVSSVTYSLDANSIFMFDGQQPDGVENGIYSWNELTGELQITAISDTGMAANFYYTKD